MQYQHGQSSILNSGIWTQPFLMHTHGVLEGVELYLPAQYKFSHLSVAHCRTALTLSTSLCWSAGTQRPGRDQRLGRW